MLWAIIEFSSLPKDLKVNLLRSMHAIKYWKDYQSRRITISDKQKLEDSASGWGSTQQGQSLLESSGFHASGRDACAQIHPLYDQGFEDSKAENAIAEMNARSIDAEIQSLSSTPETISSDDFRKAKGTWTGVGYLGASCSETVDKIEQLGQYRDNGGWSLVGFTLILKNGTRIPFQQPEIKPMQAPAALETVICDKSIIYTVKRQSRFELMVHRLSLTGKSKDALQIKLHPTMFFVEGKWPTVWEVSLLNDQLDIVLGTYSYQSTANRGGILEQKVNYSVRLPAP